MEVLIKKKLGEVSNLKISVYLSSYDKLAGAGMCNNKPVILVNDNFLSLPKSVRTVIIFHEVGHIVNGDIKDNYHRDLASEFKADEHAAWVLSYAIVMDALKFFTSYGPEKSRIEFRERLDHMRKIIGE